MCERSESADSPNLPNLQVLISRGPKEVRIVVKDEGGGIPPEKVDRVFEYAFTTAAIPGQIK